MSTPGCSCPDRRSCTCYSEYATQIQFSSSSLPGYQSYPSPPAAQWQSFEHPIQHPGQWSTQPRLPQQQFQFHNSFHNVYVPPTSQPFQGPPAFRTALGDATTTIVNGLETEQSSSGRGKRKRTTSNTGSRKRGPRNSNPATTIPAPSTQSLPPVNINSVPDITVTPPAVPGAGPSISSTPATLHPAFTRTDGPSTARTGHSLVEDSTRGNSEAATDVWYFMRPLHLREKPETLPEVEKISVDRPDPKEFPFLGCRLCT
jgi:hypothetical protein